MKKVVFTDKQVIEITNDYLCNKLSCKTIGKKFNVSKTPINNLLKEKGLLKKGFSCGKKIELSDKQMSLIKKLYLEEKRTGPYIAKILNLNRKFYIEIRRSNSIAQIYSSFLAIDDSK